MKRHSLDAIVIVGGTNLSHYSGFAGVERSMARAMLYVLPRDGDPCLIAHVFRKHLIEAHSWVKKFHYFTRLSEAPIQACLEALASMGLTGGRLGFELGFESQIQMPYGEFERLRAGLPTFAFVDVARDLWHIRSVRSAAELARQRSAAAIVRDIYSDCWAFIREGMTQGELSRFIQGRMLARGAGANYAIISAGTENYDFCGAWTPDHVFRRSDMVWMDIAASSGGYSMLFSRAGVIGGPNPQQAATAKAVHEATMAGVRAVRPGVAIAEIAAICARALAAVDAPVRTDIAALSTRFGHGVGIEFIEPPHLASYDPTILEPGMVLAVEPGISTSYGRFHFREVVTVTEDGFEQFSGPAADLVTLPAAEGG